MLYPRLIPCLLVHKNGLYKTTKFENPKYVGDPINAVKIFNQKEVDAIVFTSGKTVRHTAQLMMQRFGADWQQNFCGVKLISIGPQTSLSCQNYFQRVDKEADPHDLDGLLKACIFSLIRL